jgi:hypothetical protein
MLCAYFKMLKDTLHEQSWRLLVLINDRSDEAQVKVAFVRNGGKTTKLFVSVLCTNARNAKRAVVNVLSCNTENSMETYIPGGFSSMFFFPSGWTIVL